MTLLKKNSHITRELLLDLYENQNLSIAKIALKLNESRWLVDKLFKFYNISVKPIGSQLIKSKEEKARPILDKFPFCTEEFLRREYEEKEKSLPDIQKEFGLNYEQTKRLLEFYEIKKRSISDAAKTMAFRKKKEKTLQEKYGNGIINISQIEEVKKKKQDQALTAYGVDNFFKRKDFLKIREAGLLENHGIGISEFVRKQSKAAWASKSEADRKKWLDNSILAEDAIRTRHGFQSSKGESRISDALTDMKISHERQFVIRYQENSKKRRYLYDIFIPELNLIVEFNGDYWHANPRIYNDTDVFNFPNGRITAKERWDKEKRKLSVALQNGYDILVIWEDELNNVDDYNLPKFLKDKIYEYANSKNQIN